MVAEGLPAQLTHRVLEMSESGSRLALTAAVGTSGPSRLATDVIGQIRLDYRGVYGYRHVQTELTLGHGLAVGKEAVCLPMRKADLPGLSGRPKYRRIPNQPTAGDLVDRDFARSEPDRLWVPTSPSTPPGKARCTRAVVLDVFSRRVVGWSIDSCRTRRWSPTRWGWPSANAPKRPHKGPLGPGHPGWTQSVVATPRSWRCRLATTVWRRQREVQLYRGQMPSPGRPTVAWREDRVRFWAAIARGVMTEDAAAEAGVSSPVGFRWFRHAGGVNPCLSPTRVGPLPVVRRA